MDGYELKVREYYPDIKCYRCFGSDEIYHLYVPSIRETIASGNDEGKTYEYAYLKTIQPLKRIENGKTNLTARN